MSIEGAEKLYTEVNGVELVYYRRAINAAESRSGFEFSFDGGKTWNVIVSIAWEQARATDSLQAAIDDGAQKLKTPDDLAGELAAVMVEIMARIKALRPGERLQIVHRGTSIDVVKEKSVLAFRPSALEDAGIQEIDD